MTETSYERNAEPGFWQRLRRLSLWSTTSFGGGELESYAEQHMLGETRVGLRVMSMLLVVLLLLAVVLYQTLGFAGTYLYNSLLLAALAVHIGLSASRVGELRALHLLGMTLLTVSAAGLISVAHQTGTLSPATLASVVLLFLVVPLVPWGMREAVIVVGIIYALLSGSVWSVASRFDSAMLWTLQFFMLGAAAVSLTLVALNVAVRKRDLAARFDLERAHRDLQQLSSIDPLTGAGNRRMLDVAPAKLRERFPGAGLALHFAVLDLDAFKNVNDDHGHEVGDRALQALVRACQQAVDGCGYVLRLGGDEFAMMFVADDPQAVAERAQRGFVDARVENRDGQVLPLSVSIGMASAPLHQAPDIDALYRSSDESLYAAKARRKANAGPPVASLQQAQAGT